MNGFCRITRIRWSRDVKCKLISRKRRLITGWHLKEFFFDSVLARKAHQTLVGFIYVIMIMISKTYIIFSAGNINLKSDTLLIDRAVTVLWVCKLSFSSFERICIDFHRKFSRIRSVYLTYRIEWGTAIWRLIYVLGSWSWCLFSTGEQVLPRSGCRGCSQHYESNLHQKLFWWH